MISTTTTTILLLALTSTPILSLPTPADTPVPSIKDVSTHSDALAPFFPPAPTTAKVTNTLTSTALMSSDIIGATWQAILTLAYLPPSDPSPAQTFRYYTVSLDLSAASARINAIWLLYKSLDNIVAAETYNAGNFTLAGASASSPLASLSYSVASGPTPPSAAAVTKRDIDPDSPLVMYNPTFSANWTGTPSPALNAPFYMSLATLAAQIATAPDKKQSALSLDVPTYQSLRVQNVKIDGQENLLTYNGVLDLLARAFKEGKAKDGKGVLSMREDWLDGDKVKASWTLKWSNLS